MKRTALLPALALTALLCSSCGAGAVSSGAPGTSRMAPAQTPPPATPLPAGVPLAYNAVTDDLRSAPDLPAEPAPVLGPAGSAFLDTTFGTRILRVTDASTRTDIPGASCDAPSSAEVNTWNANGTKLYANCDSQVIPFQFSAASFSVARIGALTLDNLGGEPYWSFTNPNIMYGLNGFAFEQYDFSSNQYTKLFDFSKVIVGCTCVYASDFTLAQNGRMSTTFNGPNQDNYQTVLVWDPNTNLYTWINTLTSMVQTFGAAAPVPTNLTLGFTIHNSRINRSGDYVMITPRAGANQPEVDWNVNTGMVTQMTVGTSGHRVGGYANLINGGTLPGDYGPQALIRPLSSINSPSDLLKTYPQSAGWYGSVADYFTWNNTQASQLVPVLGCSSINSSSSIVRAEIVGVRTDGVIQNPWRFAHTRALPNANDAFWSLVHCNVSQDGHYVSFSSDWENTLGTDPHQGNVYRKDLFIVELNRITTASAARAPLR